MALPAGLGSKDPLVDGQTTPTCWGGDPRARRGYWGPEALIGSRQTPLVGVRTWEASCHLSTTAAPQVSPSHRQKSRARPAGARGSCAARALSPACAVMGGGFSGSPAGASCGPAADCFRLLTNSSCCDLRDWICCRKAIWTGCTAAAYSAIREAWRNTGSNVRPVSRQRRHYSDGRRGASATPRPPTPVGAARHAHLVLAKAQRWILELLNGFFIEVTVLLPQLEQLDRRDVGDSLLEQAGGPERSEEATYPGYLLLLLFFYSEEAGAVDGHHHLLEGCQQVLLLLALAAGGEGTRWTPSNSSGTTRLTGRAILPPPKQQRSTPFSHGSGHVTTRPRPDCHSECSFRKPHKPLRIGDQSRHLLLCTQ